MKYLVHDMSSCLCTYSEQYKIFNSIDKAMEFAQSIGYADPWGRGISSEIGVATTYSDGDVDVLILPIEEQD